MIENHLLAALPRKEYEALRRDLEPVTLNVGDILHEAEGRIRHVYFPSHGVVSIITVLRENASVEVGTVGFEGMVGIPVFLGTDVATNRAVVQVPGDGVRMKASVFKKAIDQSRTLHNLLNLYTNAHLAQVSLSVACNRFHNVETRLARWLLMIHDRVQADIFKLTQEYIARMIGTHRPHVTTAAGALQNKGLIRYYRSEITILNRQGLESASCDCYRISKEKFDGLFNK